MDAAVETHEAPSLVLERYGAAILVPKHRYEDLLFGMKLHG